MAIHQRSDCLSGRSRIGTFVTPTLQPKTRVAIAFRGDRGLEQELGGREEYGAE